MLNTQTNIDLKTANYLALPIAKYLALIRKKTLMQIMMLTIFLLFSLSANAALYTMDWRSAGDGAMTYDDNSGLWWLDLTETAGMSYSQVSAQLGAGGALEGWRYATVAEATDIYAQFGLTSGAETLPIAEFSAAIATMNSYFGDLFDPTQYADTHSGSWAITGTEWAPEYPTWHNMFVAYTYGSGASAALDLGISWSADLDMVWEYAGSLLVRDDNPPSPVPLPAALLLFPTGLFAFGLAGSRHSRKS